MHRRPDSKKEIQHIKIQLSIMPVLYNNEDILKTVDRLRTSSHLYMYPMQFLRNLFISLMKTIGRRASESKKVYHT